jgi:hypothetical protein
MDAWFRRQTVCVRHRHDGADSLRYWSEQMRGAEGCQTDGLTKDEIREIKSRAGQPGELR